GIAAILVPVVNQTLWQQYDVRPALQGWRQFLPLLLLAGVMDLLVLSENPLVLYPLALLSSTGVVMILTLVYLVVWVMIARNDNRFTNYRQLWVPLLAGFATAILQILVIDGGRFWLTGTWEGF